MIATETSITITDELKGPISGIQPLLAIGGVMGENAFLSIKGYAIAHAVKKSAIMLSIRVTMNSLMSKAWRKRAARPDHSAPPAIAHSMRSGISRNGGRFV